MRLNDKSLGYLVLLALCLLLGGVGFSMWSKQHNARDRAYIRFQELGSLQPEDPVTIRGYRVGRVAKITWDSAGARVTIALDAPRLFRTGTVFRNENFSLMGQRTLAIEPSRSGDITPPDYEFTGVFEPGIAEALHLMEMVKEQVVLVHHMVRLLHQGDSLTPSLPATMEKILGQGEQLVSTLDLTLEQGAPRVDATLRQVDQMSRQAIAVGQQTDSTLRTLQGNATLTVAQAKELILNVKSALDHLDQLLLKLENHDLTRQLLYDRRLASQLEELIATLQAVLAKVDQKGLVIVDERGERQGMVKLGNINLFGATAREKAKQGH